MRGSGTSMSAAVVSGAVAAVLAANPRLSPDGVKALLKATTYAVDGLRGAGRARWTSSAALASARPEHPRTTQPPGFQMSGSWAPDEDDAEAWAAFAAAWEAGDFEGIAQGGLGRT